MPQSNPFEPSSKVLKQAEDEIHGILDSIRAIRGEPYYRYVLIGFNLSNCFKQAERYYCGEIPHFLIETSKNSNKKMWAQVLSNMILASNPSWDEEKCKGLYAEVCEDIKLLARKQQEYANGKSLIEDTGEGKEEPDEPKRPS